MGDEPEPGERDTSAAPKWGVAIPEERAKKLRERLWAWDSATMASEERSGPFADEELNGAEVWCLAVAALAKPNAEAADLAAAEAQLRAARDRPSWEALVLGALHLERADLREAQMREAYLRGAQLAGALLTRAQLTEADLTEAQLMGADLTEAQLTGTYLRGAHLVGAFLNGACLNRAQFSGAQLTGADLSETQLAGAELTEAQLARAQLTRAHLERADLRDAQLTGANLYTARLTGANLNGAQLEGASLRKTHLVGADLRLATFDAKTALNDATFADKGAAAQLADVRWGGVNLSVVDRARMPELGDERAARSLVWKTARWEDNIIPQPPIGTRETRLAAYQTAVRANRQLAVALQAQGLNEDAARYAYRAQVLQRMVLRLRRRVGGYLFSGLLAGLAGYGYRLWRIFAVYALVVLLFAGGFLGAGVLAGHTALSGATALDALQISLNAIHGRVFFAQFGLDTAQSWLATAESIVGIVIEGVFVAMLIQRFFGR